MFRMDEDLGVSRYSGNCFDVADIKQEPVCTLVFLFLLSINLFIICSLSLFIHYHAFQVDNSDKIICGPW